MMNNKKDKSKKTKGEGRESKPNSRMDKKDDYNMLQDVKNNRWNYGIIAILCILVVLSIYFQYQMERAGRYTGKDEDAESMEDYYSTLGIDRDADLKMIKKIYKEKALAL